MNRKKAKFIIKILNNTYPNIKVPLNYKNTFTLLISVLLCSALTNVNNVTKKFTQNLKPEHFVKLGRRRIESLYKKIEFLGKSEKYLLFVKNIS